MKKPSLSVIILTRRFTRNLEKQIELFPQWIEKVLVVEDVIKSKRRQFGHLTILPHQLHGDYSSQRNWALNQSASEWTLFLDDDEEPIDNFFPQLWELLNNSSADGYYIQRNQQFMGRQLKYGDGGGQKILRLAKTKIGKNKWQGKVHETWQVPGKIVMSSLKVKHQNVASLKEFLTRLHQYALLDALSRGGLNISQLLVELLTFPPAKFIYNYAFRQGWRDGVPGFVHAWCMSYYSAIIRVYQYENSQR